MQISVKNVAFGLFTLGFMTAAQAADPCIGAICINTQVIDSYDRVGRVTAISGSQVSYLVSGSANTEDASMLSPEVSQLNNIMKGVYVADSYNRVGSTLAIFADGRVEYSVSGGLNISKTVSPEVTIFNGIKAQSTVIDDYNRVGTVQHIFQDGRAQYDVNGSMNVSASVVPAVDSFNGIVANAAVIDQYDRVGVAKYVFKDGRVEFDVSGSMYISSQAAPEVPSIGNIKPGVWVIDQYNRIGTTVHAFQGGRVEYLVNGSLNISSQVIAETAALGSDHDVSKNITIIDQYDRIGTVVHVFEDQRVNYTVSGSGQISTYGQVSPEVSSNPKYSKDTIYADDQIFIGKPAHFFKDGRIQLLAEDGSTSITSLLYSEVAQVSGYSSGTSVLSPDGTVGSVILAFDNGVLQFQYSKTDPNTHQSKVFKSPAKIFGFDPKTITNDEQNWIYDLAVSLGNGSGMQPVSRCVVKQSDYDALKVELLQRLNKQPGLVFDSRLRAKVTAFLSQ